MQQLLEVNAFVRLPEQNDDGKQVDTLMSLIINTPSTSYCLCVVLFRFISVTLLSLLLSLSIKDIVVVS